MHIRDGTCIDAERRATEDYKKAKERYISFLKLKTKEGWIEKGDDNTKIFHQSIKARRQMNKIYAIQDTTGTWMHEEQQIKEAFVSYYQGILGTKMSGRCNVKHQVITEGPVISEA